MRRLVALFVLSACATTSTRPGPQVPGPTAKDRACEVFSGRTSYALDLGETRDRQVLGLACFDDYERPIDVASRGYVQLHARFDDRRFDALTAAMMVVACAGDGACRADVEPESLGQMVFYARTLKTAALREALLSTSVPLDVVASFVERVQASQAQVLLEAGKLDARRGALYIDVPAQVRAREQDGWHRFATWYERLDELLLRLDPVLRGEAPQKQLSRLVNEATKLRDGYLSRCVARNTAAALDCLTGPIARPLTQRLVQLAIRLGDPVLAQAEDALLQLGPDQSTTAVRIARVLAEAVETEQLLFSQRSGAEASETTLTPPVEVPDLAWLPPRDLAGHRAQLRRMQGETETVHGTVRFVRPRGDAMEISFFDEPVGGLDCSEKRPEELSEDRRECADETTQVPVARVLLSVADAKPILIGNRLEAVVDAGSRRGLAVQVFKSKRRDELVQLRAVRWSR